MNVRGLKPVVAAILLFCGYVTTAAAECGFGSLCDKTIGTSLFPVQVCVNGNCSDNMGFSQIVFAYFAPDGTVLTQFNNWWNIPGVNYDTFVCRNASTKSVSRSCNGANCKPDIIPGILQAVDMTDSCSVTGNEGSLTITLTKKVHQYSKDKIFKNRSLDTNLRVQLSIRGMKDPSGAYKCDADIHASMQANPLPKLPPDIVAQDYEYAGADKTPKFTGSCNIYQGKNLYDWGKMSGKVIDAGP